MPRASLAENPGRLRAAWTSYLGIQVVWAGLVVLAPLLAVGGGGAGPLALPFCCVTAANGLHLSYFRGEYGELAERAAGALPFGRRLLAGRSLGRSCCLPLGVAYALAGVGGAVGVVLA